MKKNIALALCIACLSSYTIITKNYFTDLVEEKLNSYATDFAPEKIYLHTDKPYYTLNETIWFTSYLLNGVTHQKTNKSWVIHVELYNDSDSLVAKRDLFTNNLSVAGDIKLEKEWPTGQYVLQAYTNYMKNDGPDYFFKKNILVLDSNPVVNEKYIQQSTANPSNNDEFKQFKPDLKFYPEGGYLIENLRSKIAVKIDNIGIGGMTFSGNVVNDKNETITSFKTSDFGLGTISLSPKPNTSYRAVLSVNGVEYSYNLPKPLTTGFALGASNEGANLTINVAASPDINLNNTYLVAHQRGTIVFSKFTSEPKTAYLAKIPTQTLSNGVTHLTLFNSSGNPVCERLVYINNTENNGLVQLTKAKQKLGKRQKQTLTISTKAYNGEALPGFVSMSIRDLKGFPYNRYTENIKTFLLLNSDLRGKIEQPNYFFDGDFTNKKRYMLDLLMLTNGWRRFTWQELLYEAKTNPYNAEKGLYLSGRTQYLKKPYGPVSAKTRLTFYTKSGVSQEPIVQSDSLGRFNFGPFIFFDSIPTIVESRLTDFKSEKNRDRNVLILIDHNKTEPKLHKSTLNPTNAINSTLYQNYLKAFNYVNSLGDELDKKTQILDEITIIAKKKSEYEKRKEEMNDLTDYGFPTNRLDLENDFSENGRTVFDMLSNIPGVVAYNDTISIRGGGAPLILLDKSPVDASLLQSIMANEVSFIDVLKGADAAYYSNGGNGVIAIYSKTGNISTTRNIERKPGIINFEAKGFYTAKEFYSPDHEQSFDYTTPDIRTTLYWAPKINTTDNNSSTVTFFTSDKSSDYLIEIQGISTTGIPFYATDTFSVE